jgi:transcriptional regulator with XRE-family HTH domain
MEINYIYIRERREQLGLTQKDMANKLHLGNASCYNKLENGVYRLKAEMLPELAKILKCRITKFFILKSAKTKQEV